MDINSKKLSAISLWALWYKRNKLVNEGLNFELHELVGFVQSYGQDLSFVKTKDLTAGMKRNGLWRPPKPGIIKLNFDSSFVSNSNFSISAVIARDFEGLIMGACDSLTIIKKLETNITDRSVLNPISQHIRVLAEAFEEVTYNYVPREANRAAYELAMVGRNQKIPCFWVEEAPHLVIEVAELDRQAWYSRGGSGC
ncbi:hypothetical protein Gohar_028092, partial [Gossypium harknessii]|nr:hypothetical protein [Gossypium harknessii]